MIVDCAVRLSSIKEALSAEFDKMHTICSKLNYLKEMVDSAVTKFSQEERQPKMLASSLRRQCVHKTAF